LAALLRVLVFASWSGPGQREMPTFGAGGQEDGAAGSASVVGIDGQRLEPSGARLRQADRWAFPVGGDPKATPVTSGIFGFFGLPHTVFVDGHGRIVSIHDWTDHPSALARGRCRSWRRLSAQSPRKLKTAMASSGMATAQAPRTTQQPP
jgi:hypothetical protein